MGKILLWLQEHLKRWTKPAILPLIPGLLLGSMGIPVIDQHMWPCGVSRIANPTYIWRHITANPGEPPFRSPSQLFRSGNRKRHAAPTTDCAKSADQATHFTQIICVKAITIKGEYYELISECEIDLYLAVCERCL